MNQSMRHCYPSIISIILCLFGYSLVATAGTVEQGWQALQANRLDEAHSIFQEVVSKNTTDVRARAGLAFLARLRGKDAQWWRELLVVLENAPLKAPYLYASLSTPAYSIGLRDEDGGAMRILRQYTDAPDSLAILRAMALERIGTFYQSKEKLTEAREWYNKMGAVVQWRIAGPFENISGSGHDKQFGPETADDTGAVFKDTDGGEFHWHTPPAQRLDRWIDFTYFSPTHIGQFYAVTYVRNPQRRRVHMRIGTSGSFKLFVNSQLVRQTTDEHNNDLDTYITACTLPEGWSKVLVKVGASDLDRCNFMLRCTDEQGIPLQDLEFSTTPKPWADVDAQPTIVNNPFLDALNDAIRQNPDHLENYLFLADAHLRNDEADEATAVLRKAKQRAPESAVVDVLLLEAYLRNSRRDEYLSLMEHLAATMPMLPLSIRYRFSTALGQDRIDEADGYLKMMRLDDSTSSMYVESAIIMARRKSDIRQFTERVQKAFEIDPGNIGYATVVANLASQGGRGNKGGIEVIQRHLAVSVSWRGLELLARYQQEAGDFEGALTTYERLLAMAPIGCGYHSTISDLYLERKEYLQARAALDRAIAIAPNIGRFWYKRAVINKGMNESGAALADMERALRRDPADFEARAFIRELRGAPHPFTFMPSVNADSVIRSAPDASQFPNKDAAILYDYQGRVVYNGSRCEIQREYFVKIFTTDGIDAMKELSLSSNSSLVVEKAVVRKASGREIPADRSGGSVVFKMLEVGDIVHVKYRMMEADHGRLAAFFVDQFSFNGGWPSVKAVYALLTPPSYPFNWRTHGTQSTLTSSKNDYGDLYIWEARNLPAIEYEEDMPSHDDIDERVEVSSIPSWGEISAWYYDIARTKTRSSSEVRETMDSLFPRTGTFSKDEIIAGVYRYITRNVRYSYVPFRQSGYVPQKAENVLNTRIGDCKDVATLCIAMLAERDIQAYHVLVRTSTSPLYRAPLPGIVFDHAIVAIPGDSLPTYLDLTADNVPIGSIPYADRDAFTLVVMQGSKIPDVLTSNYFKPNVLSVSTVVTIDEDNTANIEQTYVETGAGTQRYRTSWAEASEEERLKDITEMLSEDYPDVSVTSLDVDDLETLSPSLKFTVRFKVPNYLMEAGNFLIARLPWERPKRPLAALSYTSRKHPIDFPTFHDSTHEVISLTVPKGYVLNEERGRAEINCPEIRYLRTAELKDNTLTIHRSVANRKKWVAPADYAAFKSAYNSMVKEDRRNILFMPKGTVVRVPTKGKK